MSFPYITAGTAGIVLILQMLLGFMVSGARGKNNTWIGDGGHADLQRLTRRHANLAENGGIFLVGFVLLELSGWRPLLLTILCGTFIAVRLLHALGLSRTNTNNVMRLAGGVGTYLTGFVLGAALLWLALTTAQHATL